MLGNGVSPGEKVRAARERAGLSQEELGERTGLGQHGISRIETGRSKITLDKALKIARALGMATAEILEEGTSVPRKGVSTITKALAPRLKTPAMPDRTLPVRGVAQGGLGRVYLLPDDNSPVDWLPRPAQLEGVPDAYALFVFENSMAPMYKHGQSVCVHPHLPAVPGEGVVVVLDDEEVLVKELVRRTESVVTLRQYGNEPGEFDIPASRVKKMHRIIGVFSLR